MELHVGVGDSFTKNKGHWVIIDVREGQFVCKNKETGAVVNFNKDIVRKLIN